MSTVPLCINATYGKQDWNYSETWRKQFQQFSDPLFRFFRKMSRIKANYNLTGILQTFHCSQDEAKKPNQNNPWFNLLNTVWQKTSFVRGYGRSRSINDHAFLLGSFSLLLPVQPWQRCRLERPSSQRRAGWEKSREQRGSIWPCLQAGSSGVAGVSVGLDDSSGWSGCHHSNFHPELTMHPNELRAKLTYCMSPVRNDCSEVIFCTNM